VVLELPDMAELVGEQVVAGLGYGPPIRCASASVMLPGFSGRSPMMPTSWWPVPDKVPAMPGSSAEQPFEVRVGDRALAGVGAFLAGRA
jgi:hypothetical protein